MKGFLGTKFDAEIKGRADGIVNATIEVYERISKELLPTPARFDGFPGGGGGQRSKMCGATTRAFKTVLNRTHRLQKTTIPILTSTLDKTENEGR